MKFRFLPIILFAIIVLFFFKLFIFQARLPIPSDTIVGLYHPFRDLYSKDYPNGIPFKNFLITDPVRQQYPWRELAVFLEKKLELPLWNPYSFSGTPLLANFQSAPFYPLNILFFLLPFSTSWSILIFLEILLGGIFLYLYLDDLKLSRWASFLGSLTFGFCGFSVAWLEWGTILQVGLWLPLILLSIDKIFFYLASQNSKLNPSTSSGQNSKLQLKSKKLITWGFIFIFSLVSSFFAGHLQVFFYLYIFSAIYFLARWFQFGKSKRILVFFLILNSLFIILTSVQWMPTFQFILLSARNVDQIAWAREGWFIPWQQLIQFIAPDFFGNPTTLNYWGVWNYAEFVGYIGILPFIMAIFALFFRHDKKTFFYGCIFFISLIFSLPTIFAKLPYALNIPFLSTAQPTRLLFLTDFSLAVLGALGFDYFIKSREKVIYPAIILALAFIGLWIFVFISKNISTVSVENLSIAKHNLFFPTSIFLISIILILVLKMFPKIGGNITIMIYIIIVAIISFDLLRFGLKFTPFTEKKYLFPQTRTLSFLQKNLGYFRFITTDSRILPPNFSVHYKLQSVDGYDPLYLRRYGELIAASERGRPDISTPFGFNRIITPHNYDSKIIDLLGVQYILSLTDLNSPKLEKVFQEGQTRIYQNKDVLPRAFFAKRVNLVNNKEEAIKTMMNNDFDLRQYAIFESFGKGYNVPAIIGELPNGRADIVSYSASRIIVKTDISEEGFLVFTDSFYPSWHAKIDNIPTTIYRTDYNFRGVVVPKGRHVVEFYVGLL